MATLPITLTFPFPFPFSAIFPQIPLNSILLQKEQLCSSAFHFCGGSICRGFQKGKLTRSCRCLGKIAGMGKSCETLGMDSQNPSVSNTSMVIGWEFITNSETYRNKFGFIDMIQGFRKTFTTWIGYGWVRLRSFGMGTFQTRLQNPTEWTARCTILTLFGKRF